MKKLKFITLFLLACSLMACENKDVTYPVDIAIQDISIRGILPCFRGTSCDWLWYNPASNEIKLINTQEIFLTLISCREDDAPVIDFDKYSLLYFYDNTCNINSSISKQLLQQTSANEYTLYLDIWPSYTAVAIPLIISLLTEKLPPNAIVTIDINYNR